MGDADWFRGGAHRVEPDRCSGDLKFHQSGAEIFAPDGSSSARALTRITHLGIGAHHDDLEFMAFAGIAECYSSEDRWFGGVTCTDGAGAPRSGRYSGLSDAEMRQLRRDEQRRAASAGHYAAMVQLDYPSRDIKSANRKDLVDDLERLLHVARPEIVYTHNFADKHDTHIGVALAKIEAIRRLPAGQRPQRILGCEVWRGLDWMNDDEKVVADVSGAEALAAKLHAQFDSQIAGGKRYDLATTGRRSANATFFQSHATDSATQVCLAMDMTPLIIDGGPSTGRFMSGVIGRFQADVLGRLERLAGG